MTEKASWERYKLKATHSTFRLWRDQCLLTRKQCAEIMGLSVEQIKNYDLERQTPPQRPKAVMRYAMSAIAKGLKPWNE